MIILVFTKIRETFTIEIEDRIIVYRDKKYPKGFRFMPKDADFKRIVLFSRNRLPPEVVDWVEKANSGKNLEEYQAAKDDEALVEIVVRDARVNGCVFQKKINEK